MSSEGESFDSPSCSNANSEDETSSGNSDNDSWNKKTSKSDADTWCKREGDEEKNIAQGNGDEPSIWNEEELVVVDGMKDKWFLGNAIERKGILQETVAELLQMGGHNPEQLKKRIRRWLNKKCSIRNKFGPGQLPSLRTVLYWYKQREMEKMVKENYGVSPGDKGGRFVGHLATEMSKYQRKLKEDSSMEKELEKFQKRRQEWARVGVPAKRRKQYVEYFPPFNWLVKIHVSKAQKDAGKAIKAFVQKMYREYGARVMVSVGYRDTSNQVNVGRYVL